VNLSRILSRSAIEHGERPAVLCENRAPVSYQELDRRVAEAAGELRERGISPGDPVAVKLSNVPECVTAYLGALRAGAILVPLNPLLARPEIEQRLAVSGAALLVESPLTGGEPLEEPVVPSLAHDPAVILFTSGTSAQPKGAILTHGGVRAAADNAREALGLGPDDVVLGAAPFSHVLGLSTGLVATLAAGAAVAIVERFQPEETLRLMVETGTTILLGVPTMCIALSHAARSAEALPPIRIAHVGGASVPVEAGREFERTFSCELYEGYGLTELSGIATTYLSGQERRPGSVGFPLGGTELRIAEPDEAGVGEVEFRGPSVIPGYWQDPEATAAAIDRDGWLSTGDVGRVDEDGYLYLVDRKKELIIRGGYNVYPREVEEALYAHPDVLEVAVVGVPHDFYGEEVAAVVVTRPGASPRPEELQAWAMERVAAYKYPRIVRLVDELPKGPTGKILKRAIDVGALLPKDVR
jgi:long-chain acyl-CoA synthetase